MPKDRYKSKPYDRISVVGAGAWGTALALTAALAGRSVTLWARESDVIDSVGRTRQNARFLPGIPLPPNVRATSDLAETAKAQALFIAVPAQHLRVALANISRVLDADLPLVLCAKGIERSSGKLLTEVLAEVAPSAQPAILSGPSFALDVAKGLPTAVTIAARLDIAERLQATLGHAQFRPYASDDLTGVALGGAAKNVYAIGCGVVDGLGLGESARAALIARSFAELTRLGEAMGGRAETFMGLSGLGDLVLTATSASSRNFAFGQMVGRGRSLDELRAPDQPLAEGVETAPALVGCARRFRVELPIAETVAAVLDGTIAPGVALERLMSRPLRPE